MSICGDCPMVDCTLNDVGSYECMDSLFHRIHELEEPSTIEVSEDASDRVQLFEEITANLCPKAEKDCSSCYDACDIKDILWEVE